MNKEIYTKEEVKYMLARFENACHRKFDHGEYSQRVRFLEGWKKNLDKS